ncbi:hypothetical protein MHB48_14575 [Psychrobacillus sp. FSL H8-0483]|uniref:hypothetical protein n=1 Tax=Psychrobacillus sp. FSL H8-0483 TaxID=2921389 RepID=UPI00315AF0A1
MDDKQLEDRLDLLKTSYERVPSADNTDEIIKKIVEEKVQPPYEKKGKGTKWQRITVWTVSIACVFIIGILGASFLTEDVDHANEDGSEQVEYELDILTEQFLEDLKGVYPKEREKRRQVLKLTEEEYSKIAFIERADSTYNFYTEPNYYKSLYHTATTPETLQIHFDEIISSLYLPSEMIEEVIKNETTLSDEETAQFFNSYSSKIEGLQQFFNTKETTSEDQIKALEKEGLYAFPEPPYIRYKVDVEQVFRIKEYLAPSIIGYINMLEKEPVTFAGELIYSLNDSVATMMLFENYLLESSDSYVDKDKMKIYYTEIFHAVVKGTIDQPIFDNGTVKKEYRELWKAMANETSSYTPVNFILAPIVEEFEATNWTQSGSWEALDYNDIDDALHLAINGDLEQFIENPSFKVSESLVDQNFMQGIQKLYSSFSASYDQAVLKGARAEEIVGLYYYCTQLQDYDTQYELYVKDKKYYPISKEEYSLNLGITHLIEIWKLEFRQLSEDEGVVTIIQDTTEEEHASFQLKHTENGWRAAFMPTQ